MAFKESDIWPFVVECVSRVLFLAAGSHWMPRFCARLWDRDPAMAKLLPYWEKRKQQRTGVIFLQTQPGSVGTLLWSPRWLLLRGWESTCLQSMPHCFSGIGSWHFCKIEGRREREMINTWMRSAADESEWLKRFTQITHFDLNAGSCRWQIHCGWQKDTAKKRKKSMRGQFPF